MLKNFKIKTKYNEVYDIRESCWWVVPRGSISWNLTDQETGNFM